MQGKWLILVLCVVLTPEIGQAQFGPPPGGGGRGMMSPDNSFDRMMQSYGGSGDLLDYSRVSPEHRSRIDGFSKMTGGEPMPTSGTISREQYRTVFAQRMSKAFGGPPGGAPGVAVASAPGSTTGGVTVIDFNAPPSAPTGPGGTGSGPAWGGGRGPGGGDRGPGGGGDEAEGAFQKLDQNKDGKISKDEALQSRRLPLGQVFDQYDSNRDGYLNVGEFRAAFAAMSSGGGRGGPGGGDWNGSGGSRDEPNNIDPEDERPTIYRYGKLPREFEKEYGSLDSDKDGQIGLYEWRAASREVDTFVKMDLNGDGLLTAEEYIRYTKSASSESKDNKDGVSSGNRGMFSSGSSSDKPSYGDKASSGEKTKKNGGNPWKRTKD